MKSIITAIDRLGFPFKTPDPFLFCVYHKDAYPAGDALMQAPRRGNGADFDSSLPYRMYHGDHIPGFPQHPHRGFETVTATMEGIIDHTDSCGNAGRYGGGDLQWMTAGKGVVHGEMFPLVNADAPNHTRFFQIWLNLPAKSKMVEPAFAMHWNEKIPRVLNQDGGRVTVWAGSFGGQQGLPPPPNSYASSADSDIAILFIELPPGAQLTLPAAKGGALTNRMMYFIEGKQASIGDQTVLAQTALTLRADADALITNTHASDQAEFLMLQGRPIGERVAQHGPFVMNTDEEIKQAFADYRRTQFGGWPWPQDAMVFPRSKGRFALQNGVEQTP